MKTLSVCVLMLWSIACFAVGKLDDNYLVTYGDPDAPYKVIQYFSFTCPHCVGLFRKEFKEIQSKYIDSKKIYWVFQPVPMDLLTVQGMHCLNQLSEREKKIFLEAILEEVLIDNPKLSLLMMQKAMEMMEKPIPKLGEKEFLSETQTFKDAFDFISNEEELKAVPAIEINGKFFEDEVPDNEFLKKHIETPKTNA